MARDRDDRFTDLYERTHACIVAYVMRRSVSRDDAADAIAETYAIAWRRFDEVPTGDASLLWLYVTARYVLANLRRRSHREEAIGRLAADLGAIDSLSEPQDEERLAALTCLGSLPEDQREVLMLASWEGLSGADIGRVLGCSPAGARVRLHRARAALSVEVARLSAISKHASLDRHVPRESSVPSGASAEA